MSKIVLKAFTKLNFNLHILPKLLPNGYHELRCLNQQASQADQVILKETGPGINLFCDHPNLTDDEHNLAYRAAVLIIQEYQPYKGVIIELKKHIPIAGGLGGGSADAAAVILGLNDLWNLNLNNQQKIELGKKLGMDVCYSVIGGTCLVSGAGEIVKPQDFSFPGINLIIISPEIQKSSSAWAYALLKDYPVGQNLLKLTRLVAAFRKKDLFSIAQNLHNDFEEVIFREFPEVAKVKAKMLENGALGAILAGSGLSVFGIWENQKSVAVAFEKLKKIYPQTFLTQTV